MSGQIVVFGATGYTGRLTAEALVRRGQKPVLAARNATRLNQLVGELGGGLETRVADVSRPETVHALAEKGDVMVATVGPFVKWGDPAAEAAVKSGAHYLDSTGEPPFVRKVFEYGGPRAERSGTVAMTAMAYDWVPGNLTGALALSEAEGAVGVRIGYFATGSGIGGMSGGTRASLMGTLTEPSFQFRGGKVMSERGAKKLYAFDVAGKTRQAVSVGTSEAYSLPRVYPGLRDVEVYLGWFGPQSRAMQVFSFVGAGFTKIPGVRSATGAIVERFVKTSTGGPDEEARKGTRSVFVAEALGSAGEVLSRVETEGINSYEFSGRVLAWAAEATAAATAAQVGAGARGPVEAFGLARLEAGVAECGISRSH